MTRPPRDIEGLQSINEWAIPHLNALFPERDGKFTQAEIARYVDQHKLPGHDVVTQSTMQTHVREVVMHHTINVGRLVAFAAIAVVIMVAPEPDGAVWFMADGRRVAAAFALWFCLYGLVQHTDRTTTLNAIKHGRHLLVDARRAVAMIGIATILWCGNHLFASWQVPS